MVKSSTLFQRKSLDQITAVPNDIISVYVVENHIWADGGSHEARAKRQAQSQTVEEFLIDPVRSFLNDIFRQLAAPHMPSRKDMPIGQGYWIQAEFGSGKSHLLSFIGALALGREAEWNIIREKERLAGLGRRESLYSFYENGLAKKSRESKGILIAVKTLVGQGGGTIGVSDATKTLTEYVLDAVAEQFHVETGKSLPLYPAELLADRFLNTRDFELYRRDLAKFLSDPAFYDEEEQEDIQDFLDDLQNSSDPGTRRDCGQRLWDFYTRYLQIRPDIPMEAEDVLKHMVQRLLDEGYAGLLLILDEVSLFMKGRNDAQRVEDEKTLVVLSNRLAKVENLPVWTVCAAQQAIETKMVGVKNIIARERLDLVPLLNNPDAYYDIALQRVREITDSSAIAQYYEDYKRSFSWPQSIGQDEFTRFFPFYPPSIGVVRTISYNLTSVRSALYFMLQTLKTQRKRRSSELITLWALFNDVVEYEEDPSGTTKGIASVKTKWPEAWQAYEAARRQLDTAVNGPLRIYRSRCEKLIKTLFLYHVADVAPNGLGHEELMNSVMEWKDHATDQEADLQDNLDHYEVLTEKIAVELAQVVRVGQNFRFNPTGSGTDPREHFQKARAEAEQDEVKKQQAWEALLTLDSWKVTTRLMTLDLAQGTRSIFREIAPSSQQDVSLKWHGREITGRVLMRDLLSVVQKDTPLPSINSAATGLDFAAFISTRPVPSSSLEKLVASKGDPRVLFWAPDGRTPSEESLLIDFAAYRTLVAEFGGRDTQEAKEVLGWVQNRLRDQIGTIYRIVPDSYGRGQIMAQDHSQMSFICQGELPVILTPLVEQVLDGAYVSRELTFESPAPFNDANAIYVINGIVKDGKIPRGARPNRYTSAAQNYGFDLQIMRRPNDRQLDLGDCRYTQEMLAWINEKLGDTDGTVPVDSLYKNFMGIGGPGGLHYGLSKRMVQLYLLCLVRDGRIRITLAGHSTPVDVIDYSNIASVEFKTSTLDAFDQVRKLQPPEGWENLAPFAAILLQDERLREIRQDGDIQAGILKILDHREKSVESFRSLKKGIEDLFEEIGQANPLSDSLVAWETFLTSPMDTSNPLPFLRNALDKAFGYSVYQDDRIDQDEVDDFAARFREIQQAQTFYAYSNRIRAAARYVHYPLPDEKALQSIQSAFANGRSTLTKLDDLIQNETRLRGELLEPVEEAIQSYSVRYLQVFDQVTAHAEEIRQQLADSQKRPTYQALDLLADVEQLGADPRPTIQKLVRSYMEQPAQLFPTESTRADIERHLKEWPQPPGSQLTLSNAGAWRQKADAARAECEAALADALHEKAKLLLSPTLQARLAQGRHEPFVAGLLEQQDVEEMGTYLVAALTASPAKATAAVKQLKQYLRMVRVVKLELASFAPSKRTIETADVEMVVNEFRQFLKTALTANGKDEVPVVELQ